MYAASDAAQLLAQLLLHELLLLLKRHGLGLLHSRAADAVGAGEVSGRGCAARCVCACSPDWGRATHTRRTCSMTCSAKPALSCPASCCSSCRLVYRNSLLVVVWCVAHSRSVRAATSRRCADVRRSR